MPRFSLPARRGREEEEEEEASDVSSNSDGTSASKRRRLNGQSSINSHESILPAGWRSGAPQSDGAASEDSDDDESQPEIHKPGSIVRVKLTNFVTYTAAEFHLGPSLNMIIGPNGTGKSTLVCAICLGLGWGPQHLGRAKDLGEFVKHGSREAEIEIELAAGPKHKGRNPIIRRNIKRDGNKSQFYINGRAVSMKDVLSLAKEFSIQIDNLCQFLPQDRVVEFAALSPTALLEQTQRAAAPAEMTEWHTKLKELHGMIKKDQSTQQHDRESLANLQSRQNASRADVERMEERNTLELRVKALQAARPFVQYTEARAVANAAKQRKRDAQRDLQELEASVEPLLQSVNAKSSYKDRIQNVMRQRKAAVSQDDDRAKSLHTKQQSCLNKAQEYENTRRSEREADKTRRNEVIKLEDQIKSLENEIEAGSPEIDTTAFNERLREKTRILQELERDMTDVQQKIRDKKTQKIEKERLLNQAKRELESLKSQEGQQLATLKRISKDSAAAWEWIQANQKRFQGEIYGPPLLVCSVRDVRYTKALEGVLRKGDFTTFTCTNNSDYTELQRQLLGRQGLNLSDINIRTITRPLSEWKSPVSDNDLAKYGLDSWLINHLDGPEPVLSMLCDSAGLHRTGATLGKLSGEQYRRLENSVLSEWVDSHSKYRVNRRREYNASSTTVTSLQQPRVWVEQGVDAGAVQQAVDKIGELNEQLEIIEGEIIALKELSQSKSSAYDTNKKEKKTIQDDKDRQQKIIAQYQALPQKIELLKTTLRSHQEAGAKLKEKMLELIKKQEDAILERAEITLAYANAVEKLHKSHDELFEAEIMLIEAESELEALTTKNKRTTDMVQERRQEVQDIEREYQKHVADAKKFKADCERLFTVERSEQEQEVFQSVQAMTSEQLEADIEASTTRLELLHDGNPLAIRDYNRRQQQIETLSSKINDLERSLEALQAEITEIKNQWEPQLDALVAEISNAFSHNFAKIGCAGQVGVYKDEDFNEWSIQIQVKFREHEQLSVLDAHRQSGGERAVSTIFYLMALQSLARSPFRVVDEINQGMDPRNERMVHERMVDIACREHTSQYFLITPKLLHGLKYHKRMKVHVIASGEYMPKDGSGLNFQQLAQVALRVRGMA